MIANFYDELAPFFHLVFADWNASIVRQAKELDSVIHRLVQLMEEAGFARVRRMDGRFFQPLIVGHREK